MLIWGNQMFHVYKVIDNRKLHSLGIKDAESLGLDVKKGYASIDNRVYKYCKNISMIVVFARSILYQQKEKYIVTGIQLDTDTVGDHIVVCDNRLVELDYSTHNPFAGKLSKKYQRLRRVEKSKQDAPTYPGTFVTGNSGVSQAYRRKLDRQLDRTIDQAKEITQLKKDIRYLKLSARLYDEGKINAQGRSITKKKPIKKKTQREEVAIVRKALQMLSIDGFYQLTDLHLVSWHDNEEKLYLRVTCGKDIYDYEMPISLRDREKAARKIMYELLEDGAIE